MKTRDFTQSTKYFLNYFPIFISSKAYSSLKFTCFLIQE